MLGPRRPSVTSQPPGSAARWRSPLLRDHYGWALCGLLMLGVTARLVLAFKTAGVRYDLGSLRLVADTLLSTPSRLYAIANARPGYPRWPYPPGLFPLILAVKGLSSLSGLGFEHLIRIPAIAADAGIAWVVQDFLGHRGYSLEQRFAAAALVALGPSFAAISAVHGQIDSIAILPAVLALWVWERRPGQDRAYLAGALIGAGAAIKGVPVLMLPALLPSVRSGREAAALIGSAAAVLLVAIVPMLALEGVGWLEHLSYNGGVGLGSLSLVAQPDLALNWLHVGSTPLSSLSHALYDGARLIAATAVVLIAALLARYRVGATLGAVMIWLTVYAFGVTFFMQYMVWGLPFFIMAGFLRQVLWLQLALLGPLLVVYHGVTHAWVAVVLYVVPMLIVWAGLTLSLVLAARRAVAERRRPAWQDTA